MRAFTRNLADITDRVPEVVDAVLALPVEAVVLDGEAIALRSDGRPEPFQVTMSRFGSKTLGNAGHALPVLLRLPPPRRRGPPRPPARGAAHVARRSRPGVDAPGDPRDERRRGGRALPRACDRARARGRDGEGALRALRGGSARRGLVEGEAGPHARPRRPRRGMGPWATPGAALEPPPRRPRPRHRRLRDARQDLQGHDGRDARLADRAAARASRRVARGTSSTSARSSSSRSPSTGSRRARATRRPRAPLRPCQGLPARQEPGEADTIDAVRAIHGGRNGAGLAIVRDG